MEAICKISLDAIASNYRFFLNRISPAKIIPVVKADAYGHGAIKVAGFLQDFFHPELFAVATLEEAQALCRVYPQMQVLIFSRVFAHELPDVPPNAILTIGSMDDARSLLQTSQTALRVHINVNTGMNRLGLSPAEVLELLKIPQPTLNIEGIYSHFSSSDTASQATYDRQQNRFSDIAEQVRAAGFSGMLHLSNSAAALKNGSTSYDAIRLGIGLYGYDTTPERLNETALSPAMTLKAPLIRVHRIEADESVSYAEKWTATKTTNIGTLRIGYADGYNRLLTNRGYASFQAKLYPVVGTVTMDHIMIDLGDSMIETGSEFILMGGTQAQMKIASISDRLDTIPYEVCCSISGRVRRIYTQSDEIPAP